MIDDKSIADYIGEVEHSPGERLRPGRICPWCSSTRVHPHGPVQGGPGEMPWRPWQCAKCQAEIILIEEHKIDRYVVVVVDRHTGEPHRLDQVYIGESGGDEAHQAAGRSTNDRFFAWVVGLR